MNNNLSLRSIGSILIVMFVLRLDVLYSYLYFAKHGSILSGEQFWLIYSWVYVLFTIPIIDYALKAYYESIKYLDSRINGISKIVNILMLGIPYVLYSFFKLTFSVIEKYGYLSKKTKIVVAVFSVLSLGTLPLLFFMFAGFWLVINGLCFKESDYLKNNTPLAITSIITSTVLSQGYSLLVLGFCLVMTKLALFVLKFKHTRKFGILEFVIVGVLIYFIGGYTFFLAIITYYIFEMIFMDIQGYDPEARNYQEMTDTLKSIKNKQQDDLEAEREALAEKYN